MLGALLLLSTAAFVLVGGIVGARLIALAVRTRQLTDFIIGFALFDLSALAYPLILAGGLGELSLAAARWVDSVGAFALALGWGGVFVFSLRVFRPGVAWARALASGGLGLIAYGFVAGTRFNFAAREVAQLHSPESPVFWLQVAAIVGYAWTACEGFACWSAARRRVALGLGDPLVANRFLLWGWIGVFAIVSVAPSMLVGLRGGDMVASTPSRFATAFAGLACAIAMQLAFLPPAAYRRWVAGSAEA